MKVQQRHQSQTLDFVPPSPLKSARMAKLEVLSRQDSEQWASTKKAQYRMDLARVVNSPLRRTHPRFAPSGEQTCERTGLPSFQWCCPGFMSPDKHKALIPSKSALANFEGKAPRPFPKMGSSTLDRPWPKSRIPGLEPAPTGIKKITPELGRDLRGGTQGIRKNGAFPGFGLKIPPLSFGQVQDQISQNPETAKAWSQLSKEDQKALTSLLHGSQTLGNLNPDLVALLENGTLFEKDKKGGRLLDHLSQLAQQELAPGIDRKALIEEVARLVNNPDRFNQDNQGTCTVTTIGRIQLQESPAEFARMISELSTPSGETTLPNGDKIQRHPDSLNGPSWRSPVERLYQDALMEYGNGDNIEYQAAENRHSDSDREGLYYPEIQRVSGAVLGRHIPFVATREGIRPGSLAEQQFLIEQEKFEKSDQEMLVGLQWGKGGHMVSVYEVRDGYVYLSNPWGVLDQGGSNPPREVVPGDGEGRIRMKLEDFLAALRGYQPKSYPAYTQNFLRRSDGKL